MRAIVIGHSGQDGRLLLPVLEAAGSEVFGFSRSGSYSNHGWRPPCRPQLELAESVRRLFAEYQPDEVYYLPAFHASAEGHVQRPGQEYTRAHATHVEGLLGVLEAVRDSGRPVRIFYASSSLVFSGEHGQQQDEATPLSPQGAYGMTKAAGGWLCRHYRERHGVFAAVGYLYNHESPLRRGTFLSMKIVRAALRAEAGAGDKLVLGDLQARVDWGYAPDFVRAFRLVLGLPQADDFIIATGEGHSVEDFVRIAFRHVSLDWRDFVVEDPGILRRRQLPKIGLPAKLQAATGWRPSVTFEEMIGRLVEAGRNPERLPQRA